MPDTDLENGSNNQEFDLRPDPRVLPMLGEINLDQWRCLGELIDNSVDGFLHDQRKHGPSEDRDVYVALPTADNEGARIEVRDSGPGMTAEVLQSAVSAGWSGNNPVDNLGLFGMGFNIATARLGSVTEVWTTRKGDAEWHGLEIDFDKLRRQKHFRTAHLRRAKQDPNQHGTEIRIKNLKPQQRAWLVRSQNQTALKKRLAQTYSAMLRDNGTPISFKLYVNNKRVLPREHCVWSEDRGVVVPGLGEVPAVINFDYALHDRIYCNNCMNWLPVDTSVEEPCPVCGSSGTVQSRTRRVRGWLGIQRYLHKTDFGLDLIRNGRKIEISSKELFLWQDENGEESEYPIDDQRNRGRFVGEIHIDHCRVSYAKDRFDRTDPSWEEMVKLIRGEGPLRPEKAKGLGYTNNTSPLFRLFRAFRRTSPQSKTAGAWERILMVKDNERASEMARKFHSGDPDFQTDEKWWELIQAVEHEALVDTGAGASSMPETTGASGSTTVDDLLGAPSPEAESEAQTDDDGETPQPTKAYPRDKVGELSREYVHNRTGRKWNVEVFAVEMEDTIFASELPWSMSMGDLATQTYHFHYRKNHEVFRSMTLTPMDALLAELANQTADYFRGQKNETPFAEILSDFRVNYGRSEEIDPRSIQPAAAELLGIIARALRASTPTEDLAALFDDLSSEKQEEVMRSLAQRKIKPTSAIEDGAFLEHAPYSLLIDFIENYPERCFDGAIWDDAYSTLDYGKSEITDEARAAVRSKYISLMRDVAWLSNCDVSDLASASRDEMVRNMMSMRLLRPDNEVH